MPQNSYVMDPALASVFSDPGFHEQGDAAPAKPAASPLDNYIDNLMRERAELAATATRNANPEVAARANVLARDTGLPAETVERNLPEIEARQQGEAARRVFERDPKIAGWASDPRHAAVAKDDWGNLATISKAFAAPQPEGWHIPMRTPRGWQDMLRDLPGNFVGELAAGFASGSGGIYDVLRSGVESIGQMTGTLNSPVVQSVAGALKSARDTANNEAARYRPQGLGFVESSLYSGIESLPTTATALGLSMMGAAAAGLAMFGATTGGQAYGQARDAGLSPLRSLAFGAAQGATEVATEALPLAFLTKGFGKTGLGKFVGGFVARELGSEEVATTIQSLNEWLTLNPEKSLGDWADSLPRAWAETALATLAVVGVTGGVHGAAKVAVDAIDKQRQARVATADAAFLDALAKGGEASKTRGRDAGAFEAFLTAQAEGTPVEKLYVDAEAVRTLYQSAGIEPGSEDDTLMGWQPDIKQQLEQAYFTGGDVVFDTARAMTHLPGTPAWAALKPDVRVRADGVSAREAATLAGAMDTALQEAGGAAAEAFRADVAANEPAARVFDDYLAKAKAVGMRPDVARAHADLMAQRYRTRGAALGIDAWEAYQRGTSFAPGAVQIAEGMDAPGAPQRPPEAQPGKAAPSAPNAPRPSVAPAAAAPVAETAVLPGNMVSGRIYRIDARQLNTDPKTFQYKDGGDSQGVTDRLAGVTAWNEDAAGVVMAWQRADGTMFVADGHQRSGLARRLIADGHADAIDLNAKVYRESDGYSANDVMLRAAGANILNGSGTAIDAAKIVRQVGLDSDFLAGFNPRVALGRQAVGLSRLSDEAFGLVINGDERTALAGAVVGTIAAEQPALHSQMIVALRDANLTSQAQMELMARDMLSAPTVDESQTDMFGALQVTRGLWAERARVLDIAVRSIREAKRALASAADNAGTLEKAGSKVDRAQAAAVAEQNAQLAIVVEKLARMTDNPVNAALTRAAVSLAEGAKPDVAARTFVDELRARPDLIGAQNNDARTGGEGADGGNGRRDGGGANDAGGQSGTADPADSEPVGLFDLEPAQAADAAKAVVETATNGSLGLFAEQAPTEGMTDAQRAELAARVQQSTNTRNDQQAVDQIEDGLFDAGRIDQTRMFEQSAPPIIELTGREIAPPGSDVGELRAAARQWYQDNLAGTEVRSQALMRFVRFGGSRKAFSASADPRKLKLFAAVRGLVENAPLVSSAPPRDKSVESQTRAYHYLEAMVRLKGEDLRVGVTIREDSNGDFYYNHSIQNDEGSAVAPRDTASKAGPRDDGGAAGDDVAQDGENINIGAPPAVFDQSARGRIEFGPRGALIRLFDGRDLSTALHESWHLFLEELRFDATTPGASPQLVADWQAMTDWFAANGHPLNADGSIPTEAHELAARGGERYLMEGKAPSVGLQAAFARFRSWLLRVYQVVGRLNAPITPEVRAVLDRMLATQAEINDALAQDEAKQLTQADLGMSDAEYAAYTDAVETRRSEAMDALLFRTMEPIRRARTKAWQDERSRLRETVADAIAALPVNRALAMLRSKDAAVRMAIDRQGLVDIGGADAVAKMPQGVPPIVKDSGGLHPDLVAEMAGFPTGQELIAALLADQAQREALKAAGDKRSPRDAAIDAETDRQMAERHGDPLNDGTIEEEARAAIANDVRSQVIASEARSLGRRANSTATPWAVAKAWAKRTVRDGAVRDQVTPAALQRHLRAEQRAMKAAEAALAAGDVNEAFRQKQAQLLNHALYRAAKAAKDDVEAATRRLGRLAKAKTLKSMDQDYLDQIHGLLEDYDFKVRSGADIAERQGFAEWVLAKNEAGEEVHIPPRLRDARATNFKTMTVSDLLGLDDTVASIAHLGRRKKKLLVAKEEREFDELVDEAVAGAAALPDRKFSNREGEHLHWARKFDAVLVKVEFLARQLDRQNPNGVWTRILIDGATEAANEKARLREAVLTPLADAYHAHSKAQRGRFGQKIHVPELAYLNADGSMVEVFDRSQLIAIALNTGTESNLDKLLRGRNWEAAKVKTVLDRELNADDWRFVETVWRQVGSLWPHIERTERELTGVVPEKIAPRIVSTPLGDIEGGYYPVVYDPNLSTKVGSAATKDDAHMFGQHGRAVATPKGHTIARTSAAFPLSLSLERGLANHVNRVTTRIAYGRYVRDALKFLNDDRVRATINRKLGPEYRPQMVTWLRRQVNEAALSTQDMADAEKLMRHSRTAVTIMGLGFRVTTMASQLAGLPVSAQLIGWDWLSRGASEAAANQGRAKAFVFARSAEMSRRADERERDTMAALASISGKRSGATEAMERARAMSMWGIGFVDVHLVAIPTWLGAYRKGLSEGMSEGDAASYGDKMVRLSQASGRAKDLATIQDANEGFRALTMFYSPFSVLYNLQREALNSARSGDLDPALRLTWNTMILSPLLAALMTGDWPDEDETWTDWAFRKVFWGIWAGIPLVREFARATGEALAGNYVGAIGQIPAGRQMEATLRSIGDLADAVQGKDVSEAWLKNASNTAGYLFGLPLGAPTAAARYIGQVATGDQHPDDLADVATGLTKGPQKDQE